MAASKLTREAVAKLETKERRYYMKKTKIGLMVGLIGLITLISSPTFARPLNFKEHAMALWIFIIIGTFIVLLQLIPAVIVFFSFIGTTTTIAFKKESKVEEGVVFPYTEPVEVRGQGNIMRGEI